MCMLKKERETLSKYGQDKGAAHTHILLLERWQCIAEKDLRPPPFLLYQILERRPSLVSMVVQSPIPTWTESRLSKTLLNIIHQNVNDDAICFFIDGLDEFDGDQQHLIDLINDVERSSNVKICVSSRPLQVLQISFSSSSRLKLEDLTRDDISS